VWTDADGAQWGSDYDNIKKAVRRRFESLTAAHAQAEKDKHRRHSNNIIKKARG
jgi:hypothetical protein